VSQRESWRREKVLALARRFVGALPQLPGIADSQPGTTIIPVVIGDARARWRSASARKQGFLVTAIRPPTVPAGTARLRVTLSAAHEEHQVDALLAVLNESLA
jgi:8-amino-7-oxononanoate synthase